MFASVKRGSNIDFVKLFAVLTALGAAFWVMLDQTGAWDVTDVQLALLTAETTAVIATVAAVLAHFNIYTPAEPLAVQATVYADVQGGIALLVGFNVVHWTPDTIAAVLAFVSLALSLLALVLRQYVTPVPPQRSAFYEHGAGAGERRGTPPGDTQRVMLDALRNAPDDVELSDGTTISSEGLPRA